LALLAMVALVGLLAWRPNALRVGVVAVALAGAVVGCVAVSHYTTRVVPGGWQWGRAGGTPGGPKLACIDASHLEAYSSDTWNDFGIAGFCRTLMRCGYLPLLLPELTPERLEQADLLISIGPARRLSRAERDVVKDFVESGGTFICMVGAEEAAASADLLADFDLRVPPSPVPPRANAPEPEPLGPFSQAVQHKGSRIPMRSYAAWKVEHGREGGWTEWVVGSDGQFEEPFVVSRVVGRGQVAVIGDTFLATNQHLESAVNVVPENVVFWRWLLTHLTNLDDWVPPPPKQTEGTLPADTPPEKPPGSESRALPGGSTPASPDGRPKLPAALPPESPDPDGPAGHEVQP
jgi:hypothetical protein